VYRVYQTPDSSVGIATSDRLDGPGAIFRYLQFFHSLCFLMYYLLPYVLMFLHSVILYCCYSVLLLCYRLDGPGSIFRYLQFFHSFCFLMYYLLPYVLMFLHSVHSVLLLLILYSVLLMYYCLRILFSHARSSLCFSCVHTQKNKGTNEHD
jgi:hypothetical protein